FTVEVQTPIGQQDAEKQAQRQDQLQEAGQTKTHDQKQHAWVQYALSGLRQVLDEATTHDDHQQYGADRAEGEQQFAGKITEDDQTALQGLPGALARTESQQAGPPCGP